MHSSFSAKFVVRGMHHTTLLKSWHMNQGKRLMCSAVAGYVRYRNQALIYSSLYSLVKKRSLIAVVLAFPMLGLTGLTVHLELVLLSKFINFPDTGRWLGEARVIWES